MCQTSKTGADNWRKELPQEPGDYVWVYLWECGCVHKAGIAWAHESYPGDPRAEGGPLYQNTKGEWLGISWEGQAPPYDGETNAPDVHYWMPVKLPKPEE